VLAEMAGPGDPAAGADERENVLPITAQGASGLIAVGGARARSPGGGPGARAAASHARDPGGPPAHRGAPPSRSAMASTSRRSGWTRCRMSTRRRADEVELDPGPRAPRDQRPGGAAGSDSTLRLTPGGERAAAIRAPTRIAVRARRPRARAAGARVEAAAPGSTQRLARGWRRTGCSRGQVGCSRGQVRAVEVGVRQVGERGSCSRGQVGAGRAKLSERTGVRVVTARIVGRDVSARGERQGEVRGVSGRSGSMGRGVSGRSGMGRGGRRGEVSRGERQVGRWDAE
jgi:hypothetical protein